jgi:hypothetical protein
MSLVFPDAVQRSFNGALRPGHENYLPFFFRHAAKSASVFSSVAG